MLQSVSASPMHHADEAEAHRRWADARLVALLLALDPVGLGGAQVTAGPGPVRDEWLRLLARAGDPRHPPRRLPGHADDGRLIGGLDLAATLQAGRPVLHAGLLAELQGAALICPMAERLPRRTVAHLTQALDHGLLRIEREGMGVELPCRLSVIALDESCTDEESPGVEAALAERLAFIVDLQGIDWRTALLDPLPAPSHQEPTGEAVQETDVMPPLDDEEWQTVREGRNLLAGVWASPEVVEALTQAADALGISELRPVWWALQASRARAALAGRQEVNTEDVMDAARLVLGPRARRLPPIPAQDTPAETDEPPAPADAQDREPEPPTPRQETPKDSLESPPDDPNEAKGESPTEPLAEPVADLAIAAAQAAVPAGLLALLAQHQGLIRPGRSRTAERASRAGQRLQAGALGRPSGVVPGLPGGRRRLSLIDTLRQAAPWQPLRRTAPAQAPGRLQETNDQGHPAHVATAPRRVIVHREDLRVVRREPRRPSTTVFVVDASGSNALNRLAEAKGAVESLLADCYVRRDRVAVIGFRGLAADLLLPPTRSLVRAKRSLAGLPGGGGTPMAKALTESRLLCEALRRRGDTVSLVLLTDGKANISLSGEPGRTQAHADAVLAARRVAAAQVASLLIDTSPKPQPQARELALAMGARYIPLPQARAGEIGRIVRYATSDA